MSPNDWAIAPVHIRRPIRPARTLLFMVLSLPILVYLKNYRVEIPGSTVGAYRLDLFYDQLLAGPQVTNQAFLLVGNPVVVRFSGNLKAFVINRDCKTRDCICEVKFEILKHGGHNLLCRGNASENITFFHVGKPCFGVRQSSYPEFYRREALYFAVNICRDYYLCILTNSSGLCNPFTAVVLVFSLLLSLIHISEP